MILKRFGSQLHSVEPHFDARALNEIAFSRSNEHSVPANEFEQLYEPVRTHEITATAQGMVQTDAEQATLAVLLEQLNELRQNHSDAVLVVENEAGRDYPKLREHVVNLIVEGENKLEFHRRVDPPLRIGIYKLRQS